jgi:hypothetical protein
MLFNALCSLCVLCASVVNFFVPYAQSYTAISL